MNRWLFWLQSILTGFLVGIVFMALPQWLLAGIAAGAVALGMAFYFDDRDLMRPPGPISRSEAVRSSSSPRNPK